MKCVRTGFDFRDTETGLIHTGDLFISDGEFFIRGIPAQDGVPVPLDDDFPFEAEVYVGGYDRREGRCDSHWSVEIESCTEGFRRFVGEWYPELVATLANVREVTA